MKIINKIANKIWTSALLGWIEVRLSNFTSYVWKRRRAELKKTNTL